ncbi:hypothetical protein SAMN02745216_02764 [Desulfatibacillum alkenivorans DSM 16219]|jgi:hypothetical protein|uniref:4Fe-4S Wbl-type domain-containing protein n=1 Tax=Desulfatibacillum alkenivorans DSM 16219 TaxID=1121393 RepID=A0A1M6P9N2_9BACT|nr:hypothetical protein [Desulfatibacillum alkenivorans]SHK04656.1 hypothetical protein SAMN02745216_02764 [Desulfatibacillum alkenivorans DSM 16219]
MTFPKCFGDLQKVFPMGEDGLRASPDECLACQCKTDCLRYALAGTDGTAVHEEQVDKVYNSGNMGFLERWSKRKTLHRAKSKKKNT